MELPHFDNVEQVRASLSERGVAFGTVDPTMYHRWKKELGFPVISKSGLVDFMANRYKYHWAEVNNVREESDALKRGSLIDTLALTPELYDQQYTCEEINRRTNAGKARAAELDALGLKIITPHEKAKAQMAADAALELINSLCGEAGYRTQIGMWALMTHLGSAPLATPLIISGMLDVYPLDPSLPLIDLKSTSVNVASEHDINKNMASFGYGIQAAMYCDLLQWCTKQVRTFRFVFVSVEPPCQTRYVRVDEGTLALYTRRYRAAMYDYADACVNGDWGEQQLPPMTYNPPMWELTRKDA